LRDNWRPVAGLALIAVGLTVVFVALVVRWLVPEIPWFAAVALGAIVAPPDASAASIILRQLRPPHRVLVILEGESLFNDASALLIYRAAVGFAASRAMLHAIPSLLLAAAASILLGLLLGQVYMRLFARVIDTATTILLQFLGVFLVWILAERLHLSGIITMVCYSITIAQISPAITPAQLRIPSYAVWEVVIFTLNILIFILVGFQLKPFLQTLSAEEWKAYLTVGTAVCVATILVRIAWVMSYNSVVRWKNRRFGVYLPRPMMAPTLAGGLVISWCGMRGIVTLATALALPRGGNGTDAFPYRDLCFSPRSRSCLAPWSFKA
jgi:monovalent cation/hydrogen antiporter